MYIKSNVTMIDCKCEDCKHKNICKWCDDMKIKQEEVSKIPMTKGLTPIHIDITCEEFEKKNKKQNSIFPTYRSYTNR